MVTAVQTKLEERPNKNLRLERMSAAVSIIRRKPSRLSLASWTPPELAYVSPDEGDYVHSLAPGQVNNSQWTRKRGQKTNILINREGGNYPRFYRVACGKHKKLWRRFSAYPARPAASRAVLRVSQFAEKMVVEDL